MANDKGRRMRARRAEEEATDWRHAYIGMEAAWKWSEEIIDTLVAALRYARGAINDADGYKDVAQQLDGALAIADRECKHGND
ncbi:MAG: hypothetical protein E5W01_11880 [Mesorhizobium sp.]|nr:MAG: hypothetical protein E5W01_11880 [Mesorhizobium sp.]